MRTPEHSLPLFLAGIFTGIWVGVAFWLRASQSSFDLTMEQRSAMLSAMVGLGGSLAGFVIAAKAILMAVSENKYIARIRQMGGMSILIGYMYRSVQSSIALLLVGFLLMPCPYGQVLSGIGIAASSSVVFLFLLALGHVFRVAPTG